MNMWQDEDCCAPRGMGFCAEGFTYFEGERGCFYGGDEEIYNTYCSQICEGKHLFGCGIPVVSRLFGFAKGDLRVNPEYHIFMEAFWMKYGAEMAAAMEADMNTDCPDCVGTETGTGTDTPPDPPPSSD